MRRLLSSLLLAGLPSVALPLLLGGFAMIVPGRVLAGVVSGKVIENTSGAPVKRVTVRAFGHGRSLAAATLSEGDGTYEIADLPPGRYALCIPAAESYRPVVVCDVEVDSERAARVDLRVHQSLAIEGDSWVQAYPTFAQSFVASGLGLTMVRIKAFGSARRVGVQVLDGAGPEGKPVGPSRMTEPVGGEGTATVCWAGDEVATTPGRSYTIRLSAEDGQAWTPGLAGLGDVYSAGSAWFDGSPRPHSDLGLLLCEDDSNLRTDYALSGGYRDYRTVSAGQTFTALSRSVTFASAQLAGVGTSSGFVRFSIHESGPGGPQIGPSKAVAPGPDAAVAWGPAEVPLRPGETYYLHIESLSGGNFLARYVDDAYARGHAVFGGRVEAAADLCACVAGQISREDFSRLQAHPRRIETVLLGNPSFEEGLDGWQVAGPTGAVVGCDYGVVPAWGGRMFGWTNLKSGEGSRTTVFRQIEATPGQDYCFSGYVFTDHRGGRGSDVKIRLIALPAGGTAVQEVGRMTSSQWYAAEGQWRRGSVEFRAASRTITVGFELEQRWSLESSQLYVDGAQLERISPQ